MSKHAHLVACVIATLCIATFFLSTLLVELLNIRDGLKMSGRLRGASSE